MNDMTANIKAGKATRKRKERGIIRERSWTGADRTLKVCWQADFGRPEEPDRSLELMGTTEGHWA